MLHYIYINQTKNMAEQEKVTPKEKKFINIYPLFTHNQIEQLFIKGNITIDVNINSLSRHNRISIEEGHIFTYKFKDGELKKIKVVEVKDSQESGNKIITFKVVK